MATVKLIRPLEEQISSYLNSGKVLTYDTQPADVSQFGSFIKDKDNNMIWVNFSVDEKINEGLVRLNKKYNNNDKVTGSYLVKKMEDSFYIQIKTKEKEGLSVLYSNPII